MEDRIDSEITGVLKKFKDLNSAYEEGKRAQKELNEFVALLRDELKLARDAERTAEFKKNRCQGFVNQQQEVILKLLSVKEENENLKCTITKMENTLADIQNSSMAEHVKKDAEIIKTKQDYLKELIKIQESADEQVLKTKAELNFTIEDLRKTIAKKEEAINDQSNSIISLQTELKDVKDRAEINLEVYQKKLAEQERKYQAELETWKVAELNQASYQQMHINNSVANQYGNSSLLTGNPYQPGSLTRQMSDYQHNMSLQRKALYSNVQMNNPYQSVVSRSRHIQPGIVRPMPNCFQKNTDFLSAHDYYLQNQNLMEENKEAKETDMPDSLRQIKTNNNNNQKPKVPNKKRKLFNSDENLL